MEPSEPFTPEQERDLVRRAKRGDEAARNRLMTAYFRFAQEQCRRHGQRKGLDRDDAESEVFFALAEAIAGFDLRRSHTRFSAYLAQRCRGAATWAAREQKKQALVDARPWRYKEQDYRPTAAERRAARSRGPVCRYWPPGAIAWAKGIRRRHDRYIAQWLWLEERPLRQVEIAKRLRITRAAVSQRLKLLVSELRGRYPNIIVDQDVTYDPLNTRERGIAIGGMTFDGRRLPENPAPRRGFAFSGPRWLTRAAPHGPRAKAAHLT
jgi:hypothetical protein